MVIKEVTAMNDQELYWYLLGLKGPWMVRQLSFGYQGERLAGFRTVGVEVFSVLQVGMLVSCASEVDPERLR